MNGRTGIRGWTANHRLCAGALAVAALLLGACNGTSSRMIDLGTAPSTAPSTPSAASAAPPVPTTTTAPEPADDLSGFQTDPLRRERAISVPPVAVLTGIRSARHDGFDRVVFDFAEPLPAADAVRYVDHVTADGSGQPVAVAGRAFLVVRFEQAQAHTDAGSPTIAARRLSPNLPVISEIVEAGDYEGYVTIALGLTAKVPFRVFELANPSRIVVDVRSAS